MTGRVDPIQGFSRAFVSRPKPETRLRGCPPPDMWHRPRSDMPSIQLFNKFYNEPQEGRITEVSLQEPRMQTLAQILAGIPADPYDNQSQGIAPLLQQRGMLQNSGMQQMPPPGMGQDQLNTLQGGPMPGANEPLPPQLLQLLLQRQQQQQQPGMGSMGDPMGGGY